MQRKIDKMHSMFGIKQGSICKDCKHLKGGLNEYRKCRIYGVSASEATDWCLKYTACGLYNKDYKGDVPIVRLNSSDKTEEQIPGQMSLFD